MKKKILMFLAALLIIPAVAFCDNVPVPTVVDFNNPIGIIKLTETSKKIQHSPNDMFKDWIRFSITNKEESIRVTLVRVGTIENGVFAIEALPTVYITEYEEKRERIWTLIFDGNAQLSWVRYQEVDLEKDFIHDPILSRDKEKFGFAQNVLDYMLMMYKVNRLPVNQYGI